MAKPWNNNKRWNNGREVQHARKNGRGGFYRKRRGNSKGRHK